MNAATATPSPMRTILLSAELGRKFGRRHRFAVNSPGEAIRALIANFPDFRAWVCESGECGVGYRVLAGGADRRLDEINNPTGRMDIRIVPVIQGAGKGGIFEVLAGVALIATAIAFPGIGLGLPGLLGGVEIPLSGFIGSIGLALALGGITNLISPQVQTNQNSYDIRGNVNTVAQGNPVPIGYGEMFCGSAVISAEIVVDNVPTQETGVPGLSAVVQTTTNANGVTSNQCFVSWQPAGQAIGYDVTVFGNGQVQVSAPRTNGTSVYVAVSVNGPLTVICNPVEPDGTYGPGSTVHSVYIGAAP